MNELMNYSREINNQIIIISLQAITFNIIIIIIINSTDDDDDDYGVGKCIIVPQKPFRIPKLLSSLSKRLV